MRRASAEPVHRTGLGAFFGGSARRRLLIAFAISIALHEIVAGLVPANSWRTPANREVIVRASVTRIAVRIRPSPKPPKPRPHRFLPLPVAAPIKLLLVKNFAGRSAHQIAAQSHPALRLASSASDRPVWDATASGAKNGALVAAGLGAGAGNGAGLQGNGTGAASGDEPCGFVEFSDPHGSQFDRRTGGFWVDVRMSVHFADGSSQSLLLDYPWYYPNEAANPWSDQNLHDPNFPTRFQSPPSAKTSGEPELVQYVIHHSTPDGMTLLKDCPTAAPSS
jgi:hypothetical protein